MTEEEDEKKETESEEKSENDAKETSGESSSPEEPALIGKANEAAERLEKANTEQSKLLKKQEELLSEQRLQGKSMGGGAPPKKELSPEDFADEFMESSENILMTE